jgi:hypothetical protein
MLSPTYLAASCTDPDNCGLCKTPVSERKLGMKHAGISPFPYEVKEDAVSNTLSERGQRYGKFTGHAEVTQDLKQVVNHHLLKRGKLLAPDQQEAIDMIMHKIGRIVNGDPDYADSWHDIAGYAKLVDDRLNGKET